MMKILAVVLALLYCLGVYVFLVVRKKKKNNSILDNPLVVQNSSRLINETITLEDQVLGISVNILKQDIEIENLKKAGHLVFELQSFLKEAKNWKKNEVFEIDEISKNQSKKDTVENLYPNQIKYLSKEEESNFDFKQNENFDDDHFINREFNPIDVFYDEDFSRFKESKVSLEKNILSSNQIQLISYSEDLLDEDSM